MFSSNRLSLKAPDSPIEQQAFRSRSFRRFIVTACTLFLLIVTINSVNLQNELRQRLADDYLIFHRKTSTSWIPQSRHVENTQASLQNSEVTPNDKHVSVEQQIRHLPEVIRIPFEEAVSDVVLQGWEDEWFSSVTFNLEKHGYLPEPKIDFVYNC